jgi:hypothetical protein
MVTPARESQASMISPSRRNTVSIRRRSPCLSAPGRSKVPVVSIGALYALESTGTPKSAGQNLGYVMHLATPLITRAKAAIQDGHPCAGIAGINDIPVSSKHSQHPKTQPVPVRSGKIKSPGGIGRRARCPRINRYSEKCRPKSRVCHAPGDAADNSCKGSHTR